MAVCAEVARTQAIRRQSRKRTLNGLWYFILEPTGASPPCEANKGEIERGVFSPTPCRKSRGEDFSKLRSPWKSGTNEETPGHGFQPMGSREECCPGWWLAYRGLKPTAKSGAATWRWPRSVSSETLQQSSHYLDSQVPFAQLFGKVLRSTHG